MTLPCARIARPTDLADPNVFWGKLNADNPNVKWLLLSHHSVDVGVTFYRLAQIPGFKRTLETAAGRLLNDSHLQWLAIYASLHDLIKANHGFQDYPFGDSAYAVKGHHGDALAELMSDDESMSAVLTELDLDLLRAGVARGEQPDADVDRMLQVVWSHHGKPIRQEKRVSGKNPWKPDGRRAPAQAASQIMSIAKRAFPFAAQAAAEPIELTPRLQHALLGLVTLADWIGSHQGLFPLTGSSMTDEDRIALAKQSADQAVALAGLDSLDRAGVRRLSKSMRSLRFEDLFEGHAPRPLQKAIADVDLTDPRALTLVAESDTGSGKTEAALFLWARLLMANRVEGLFFALPTRVAARELYARVCRFVETVFPAEIRPAVLLAVPGYAVMTRAEPLPSESALFDADALPSGLRQSLARWASESSKKFLAAPVVVGTIDQGLLSVLQVKHAHMRSILLDRLFFVVDEVHSSDTYMRTLLKVLLKHRKAQGAHTLLLSATLSAEARADLMGDTSSANLEEATHAAYPSITGMAGYNVKVTVDEATRSKAVNVRTLAKMSDVQSVLRELVLPALAQSKKVLMVFNTVNRAITAQKEIERLVGADHPALFKVAGVPCLHHGRYAPADRAILDKAVTDALGRNAASGALVVIGTQTLEQSLDLDADLLITDLCPIDVLLQRIGRLWRHERTRTDAVAQCVVLTPTRPLINYVSEKGVPGRELTGAGLGSVYGDLRTLELTRSVIGEHRDIVLPRDNRLLVESALHSAQMKSLMDSRWAAIARKQDGAHVADQAQAATRSLLSLMNKHVDDDNFKFLDTDEQKIGTRLGAGGLEVDVKGAASPFGHALGSIMIPGFWATRDTEEAALSVTSTDHGLLIDYGSLELIYDRFGLQKR